MPYPEKGEKQSDFIARAIKTFMSEGYGQKEAVGRAYGFWSNYSGPKKKGIKFKTNEEETSR
jgi:hypothetical protein